MKHTQLPPSPAGFTAKKAKILSQLSTPEADYTDASPKGSVDAGIRDLIDEINARDGLVTTSSCAGRISVFVEGSKTPRGPDAEADRSKPASAVGGKGGGGTWLYVSHDPVDEDILRTDGGVARLFGFDEDDENDGGGRAGMRLIHFKFEPMILHILTASPQHAQLVLKCGLQAGFRESGAVSLLESTAKAGHVQPATPMVAIRSMGLSFESLVGEMDGSGRKRSLVSNEYLRLLVAIANERFVENRKRIGRFLDALRVEIGGAGEVLEESRNGRSEKELRRETKRAEGLRRQAEARKGREDKPVEEHEQEVDDTVEYTALP